jgi:hypothetical protein
MLARMLIERVMFRFDAVKRHTTSLDELYSCLRPELVKRKAMYMREEGILVAQAIEVGVQQGVFAVESPAETAHLLLLATNAMLPYSLSPAELGKRKELESRATKMADLLVRSLTCGAKCFDSKGGE